MHCQVPYDVHTQILRTQQQNVFLTLEVDWKFISDWKLISYQISRTPPS